MDGNRPVHRGEMYDRGARAEFDALAVVVPIFAALGANRRVALERAVTFRFHQHAGLIPGGNLHGKRTVVGVRFDAGAIPVRAAEGNRQRAILCIDAQLAAIAF